MRKLTYNLAPKLPGEGDSNRDRDHNTIKKS
jgi:hypothetical protein